MNKNYNVELLPEDLIENMRKSIYNNYSHFISYSNINQSYLALRTSLFSLIHKISNKMNFKSSTYFLSIYYLDLIFLKNKIPHIYNDNYELLALTCLVLAAKHLENDPTVPHLKYFINAYNYILSQIMNDFQSKTFSNYGSISFNDLFISEVLVCKLLNYKLNYFTIYDFNSFFFGHGILKIEQLEDIPNDEYSTIDEKIYEDNEKMNYINPEMVKKILEKIYKKSRYYLDNIVKNKISLKYDSFLISIFIMYKSVEHVMLKENKLKHDVKTLDKYYLEKNEDILRRKTSKCFKDIMNEIYKIDLDCIEEYQYLINDDEFLKLFYPYKYNNNTIKNNKNEFDISERIENHKKYQTNIVYNNEKTNKYKAETIETKKFSPKKIYHMKIPSETYNKIKRLKILERLNKNSNTSKNKFKKSFILNSKEKNQKDKINNTTKDSKNKNEKLSKSNYNIDFSDIKKRNNTNTNKDKDKHLEGYNLSNNIIKQYNNDTSFIKNSNEKDKDEIFISESNSFYIPKLGVKREKKLFNILSNTELNKNESNSNKNLININQNPNKIETNDYQNISIRPYAKKVIPKINKNKNNQNINVGGNNNNMTKKYNKNININASLKKNISFNNAINLTTKNYELRNSNINKYKKNTLDNNLNDSIDIQKDISPNHSRVNINMIKLKKDNKISTINQNDKFRHIPSINNNKKSVSINKIRVNGALNRHKLNKKLFVRMEKTPMKTEQTLRNAIKRNIGVKRNNNISSINKTVDNSFEEANNEKEKMENKNYSYINFSSNNIKNINNKNIVNIKNNNNIITNQRSSSSDEDDFGDDNDNNYNNYKSNNIRIDQYELEDGDNYIEEKNNNIKADNYKRYSIKKIYDKDNPNITEKNAPKIELIRITKKRAPTIVINNNFNVNFENKSISSSRPFSKFKKYKIK